MKYIGTGYTVFKKKIYNISGALLNYFLQHLNKHFFNIRSRKGTIRLSFGLIFETGSKKGITGQYYVLKSVRSGKYRRYLRRVQ